MTQATFETKEGVTILAVVVPIGSTELLLTAFRQLVKVRYYSNGQYNFIKTNIRFNRGKGATIIGPLSQLTEEQAKEIVKENFSGFYRDYQDPGEWQYGKALLSLQSLIRSLNLNFTPEQDVLLIKIN